MTPPPLALKVALVLLVADGVAALHLAEFLGWRGIALVTLLLAASWLVQTRAVDPAAWLPGGRWLVPVAALASVADVVYLAENLLDALVRLLLFLVLYKFALLRVVADTRTIAFLAFFMLVCASTSAFGPGFLFVFLVFVGLVSWVALYQHVLLEGEGTGERADAIAPRTLLALAGAATASVFLVTMALFFTLPRIGLAALPLRARLGTMMTGFSERLDLGGGSGTIFTDSRVAMRVHLPDEAHPEDVPNLRWRGVVLDAFDGRAWTARHPRWIRIVRPNGGSFEIGTLRASGRIVRQEIFLEPLGTEAIFTAPHALRVSLPAFLLAVDDMGAVTVPSPGARLRYTVESELEGLRSPERVRHDPVPPLSPVALERYVQLPELAPRIAELARRVAAGSRDAGEIARRLERYLAREFRYTLDVEPVSGLDPLEAFLFVRRAGHCEYFAAAMAVMLRTLGVPARVVNGFQRGEWNPYGRYFLVRYQDAHSWVEAYVPGTGWTTFDPTPRVAAGPAERSMPAMLYLDALRLQWHRYVVNWSLRDQIEIVRAAHVRISGVRRWSATLDAETRERLARAGSAVVVVAVALVGGWSAWRRRRPGARGRPAAVPRFYRHALRAVARRGLRPGAGETAREFSGRVAGLGSAAADAFARVTALYERARFGGTAPSPAELEDAESCLTALRHARRAAGR
jgi:transglutaminase-like putative cysteine protease